MFESSTINNTELNKLIEDCSANKRQAQSQLYELLAPKMFAVCLRYSKTRQEAEEILQEGFIKVFEFLHQFKNSGPFEAWVRKIMVNCALTKYRRKSHLHAIIPVDHVENQTITNEEVFSVLGTKELLRIIQGLPSGYRMVFNLYVFEGLKHREIAELLDISEGTSKSNLSDARAILQKEISKNIEIEKRRICL